MTKASRQQARWAVIHQLNIHKGNIHKAASVTRKSVAFVKRWQQHYKKHKNVNDKPRSGRPGKISAIVREAAVTLVAEEQFVPAATAILKQQQLLDSSIHHKTVLRAVRQVMDCKPVQARPILNHASRAKRVKFSRQQHDPDRLIAIDSTYFTLGTAGIGQGRVHQQWLAGPIRASNCMCMVVSLPMARRNWCLCQAPLGTTRCTTTGRVHCLVSEPRSSRTS